MKDLSTDCLKKELDRLQTLRSECESEIYKIGCELKMRDLDIQLGDIVEYHGIRGIVSGNSIHGTPEMSLYKKDGTLGTRKSLLIWKDNLVIISRKDSR